MIVNVALTGHARSGKTTAANILERHGFSVTHIADPIRRIAYASMPDIRRIVDGYGWDRAKLLDPRARVALQDLGTAIRAEFGEWQLVSKAYFDHSHGAVVVADVRTNNEADYLTYRGFTVVELTREGTKPANNHILERGIERHLIHISIENNGTLADLETALITALGLETS